MTDRTGPEQLSQEPPGKEHDDGASLTGAAIGGRAEVAAPVQRADPEEPEWFETWMREGGGEPPEPSGAGPEGSTSSPVALRR